MFKKISWYSFYKKTIKQNKSLLYSKHDLKIDWINRLYKTYTLSNEDVEEIKIYGGAYVNNLIEKDKNKIEKTFIELGIQEFIAIMEIEKLNDRQIGLAFRFRFFDISKILSILIWISITLVITSLFFLNNMNFKSIYFGLIVSFVVYIISRFFKISRI